MRPKGSAATLERRRFRAILLLSKDSSLNAVARELKCAPSSVLRWRNALCQRGMRGLTVGTSPGRPPKLTAGHRRELLDLLLRGPLAHGYPTGGWTTSRVVALIQQHFAVQHHPNHVRRILRALGWSIQRAPRRAARQGDSGGAPAGPPDGSRPPDPPRGWGPPSLP